MNFILVQYKHQYKQDHLRVYYQHSEYYHDLMIEQIKTIYKDHRIHVLTNVNMKKQGVVYHFDPDLEPNNYAKLKVFGLLDEPAIYVDSDVILVRRFLPEELPTDSPFNLYQSYTDTSKLTPEMQTYPHYNTGVMWIPRPDQKIVEALLSVRNKFMIHPNGWVNDEYPISWFVKENGLKMATGGLVNRGREHLKASEVGKYQSVHYTGPQYKNLLPEELARLRLKML
jgi:hypothetical protein